MTVPGGLSFWDSWQAWATSDGIGNLLVTPFILGWADVVRSGGSAFGRKRALEGTALFVVLVLAVGAFFVQAGGHQLFPLFLPYVFFPFLLWAVLRFEMAGSATATLLIGVVAVFFASTGRVPAFSLGPGIVDDVIVVQLLLGATAVPVLFLAAAVAERHQAGSALRDSETRYRRLFEAARDGILMLDAATGTIVDVNPFLIELLGLSREAFLGKTIWELGFLKDVVANEARFEELQRQGYVRYEDLPLETADGRQVAVEFVSNVYLVNGRKVIQCNIRDITERKRAEDNLRTQLDELRRWQEVMLDREDRVQELKREVNDLCRRAGETARYPSQEAGTSSEDDGTGKVGA